MRYNKIYYIQHLSLEQKKEIALPVKGSTYKDSRLFVYKHQDGYYVLTDIKTGMRVVKAQNLKDLDRKFMDVQDVYEDLISRPDYHRNVKHFAALLLEAQ